MGSAVESARGGWGFCTIRSIAAACRRRVASLLTQFPPRDREGSGKPRGARWGGERGTPWGTAGSAMGRIVERAMRPARCGWGFCTIRRIATACRRRVESLLTQFPPRDREESGKPRGVRWGGKWGAPWSPVGSTVGRRAGNPVGHGGERGGESAARRKVGSAVESARGGWGFCTIRRIATACRRRVASLLTQFPPRGGRRARNPADTPRRSSLTRGTRCRTRGKHGREVRSCPHGQRSGSAPTRTPAPAVSQVSHRSFDHPSGAPDPE